MIQRIKRTAFELTGNQLGAQKTIGGGGRYDGLSKRLGGKAVKGFACGVERMGLSLPESSLELKAGAPTLYIAYIAYIGDVARRFSLALTRRLREAGISAIVDLENRKLKKSLAVANNFAARYALIVGEDETQSGGYVLRDMTTGEQQKLDESELTMTLK